MYTYRLDYILYQTEYIILYYMAIAMAMALCELPHREASAQDTPLSSPRSQPPILSKLPGLLQLPSTSVLPIAFQQTLPSYFPISSWAVKYCMIYTYGGVSFVLFPENGGG